MKYVERFTALLNCSTEEDWKNSIIQIGADYGYEKTLIAIAPQRPTSLREAFLRSNYSSEWLSTYDAEQFVNVDPTVAHCVLKSTPLIWEPALFAQKKQREMYEEASCHGLRSGITFPFHGSNGEIGILCFVSDEKPGLRFQREVLNHAHGLSMMRDFAFEASQRFAKISKHHQLPALTKRELECLKWCAAGKSSWETSKILLCSEAVVNFHFMNLRRKFHATSRRQVVVKAIHCGLLRP